MKVKSLSRARLFATPWTVAYHAPPSRGFSRRTWVRAEEEWTPQPCLVLSVSQWGWPRLPYVRQPSSRLRSAARLPSRSRGRCHREMSSTEWRQFPQGNCEENFESLDLAELAKKQPWWQMLFRQESEPSAKNVERGIPAVN